MIYARSGQQPWLRFIRTELYDSFGTLGYVFLINQAMAEMGHFKTIEDEAYVGRHSSMAFDVGDSPHVNYEE